MEYFIKPVVRKSSLIWATLIFSAACAGNATAQEWPTKPITVLAPFAAGGTVDIVARLVGQHLQQELGQPIIVENKGGAGGTIATALLARAQPNGYTLMVQHQGLAFNAALYSKLSYDTLRDIGPVAYIGATPNVLVVTNALPVKSVAEFLSAAKADPGKINYGSGGIGSAGHIPMEVLQMATGVKMTHVPYKGSGPAIVDLMSGRIEAMLLTIPAVMPHIQSGKVRPIATSGRQRSPALPSLPTLQEAGVANFDYSPWYGFFAPAGTPEPVLTKLHAAVNKVLAKPEVIQKLSDQGLEVQAMPREQFASIVKSDVTKWGKIINSLAIKVD